jgi:NADH:ubiquinone oxidoreductase subunit K
MIKRFKHNKKSILIVLAIWLVSFGTVRFAVPYIFNNVFECYQSTRIYSMIGKEYDCSLNKKSASSITEKKSKKPDDYNVKQSKIAIGSGGFWGRGFLKGTQTRGRYVPAQHTDFIFTSLGEAFGFVGTFTFLALYLFFLFRLIRIAERQRSTFSRVYAYSVVGIFLNRKNVIVLLMAIELMLLSVNMNFVAFSHYLGDMAGQVFVFFILTVAAAEAAIGLAILVVLFRKVDTIDADDLDHLKG